MLDPSKWLEPDFLFTLILIGTSLAACMFTIYFLKRKDSRFNIIWESTKSWFILTPILFFVTGLNKTWVMVLLVLISIYSLKTFFKMTGMYHRSWFIVLSYIFTVLMGYFVIQENYTMINLVPILLLGTICMIPIIKNSYSHMVQYTSLTFLGYIFLAWSLLHFGLILQSNLGVYTVFYIILLSELNDAIFHTANIFFGRKKKIFSKIAPSLTIEGLSISTAVILIISPNITGLIVVIFARLGSLTMSFIRKDLGVKDSGLFVIGQDDILARVDKLIFIAPTFYYIDTLRLFLR